MVNAKENASYAVLFFSESHADSLSSTTFYDIPPRSLVPFHDNAGSGTHSLLTETQPVWARNKRDTAEENDESKRESIRRER